MKKVSILSPCYNVAKYIDKFISSVIIQDYRPLELILVDDGSTDETAEIICKKKAAIEDVDAEISIVLLKKENGGLASAIALGLKYVTGDYLTWPDPDDFLLEHSIRKRVEFLEDHPSVGMVRSNGYVFNEGDYGHVVREMSKIKRTTYIEDFAKFQVTWMPGCYMVRMSVFDEMNPQRYVYDSAAGQDIQMMLPVVYKYPCYYLDEHLFGYLIRENSHSRRGSKDYEHQKERLFIFQDCVEKTLSIIPENTDDILRIHKAFIRKQLFENAWNHKRKDEMQSMRPTLIAHNEYTIEERLKMIVGPNRISVFLFRLYHATCIRLGRNKK